jgi:hypothetical protein
MPVHVPEPGFFVDMDLDVEVDLDLDVDGFFSLSAHPEPVEGWPSHAAIVALRGVASSGSGPLRDGGFAPWFPRTGAALVTVRRVR